MTGSGWTRSTSRRSTGPRDVPAALAWVMHGLPPHAVRRIPGGPALRDVGGHLVRRFARAERRTFRYVAPAATA
ncbi:hypothetical protein GCM10022255_091250 [Dactylosporangium darangshiense]|uniref:Uncharacterized protein n=1 Tax=Dactylosporangium darangshiense TaxID=579108 RepID=A0ABP8DP96_9ACTN